MDRSASQAWRDLANGTHPEDPDGRLRRLLRRLPPAELARRCVETGVAVHLLGGCGYPTALAGDDEAPAVLCSQGATTVLDAGPRVAVVGTRSASAVGREVAEDIGGVLALAGVAVVSGLAEGIGTAVLRGAADAADRVGLGPRRATAVLGTAHDAVAGAEQERLRRQLALSGCVLSELPPGAPSARWRFGARNRIVVALAELLVVVECHGGEADDAIRAARRRGVPVAAVPGSVRSAASMGTNALLVDGAACVRDGADALSLLAARTGWDPPVLPGAPRRSATGGPPRPGAGEHLVEPGPSGAVLTVIAQAPADVGTIARQTGASIGAVALCLEQLAAGGRARADGGWWRAVPLGR